MSRPSRFMRSMTPSGSVKMSASRFNLVCGKTREMACLPNIDRIPNPQPPKVIDARVTTPTMGRKEYGYRRDRSVSREVRAPAPPARESSLYLPFGSYADLGCHTKPPSRYSNSTQGSYTSSYSAGHTDRHSRRSMTPLSFPPSYPSSSISAGFGGLSSRTESRTTQRRSSATFTQQSFQSSRQRHTSCSYGTPASSRGLPFY